MRSFIQKYWKMLIAIAYAIAVPLYFMTSTRAVSQALDQATISSNTQIETLQKTNQKQKEYYDKLLEDYQNKFDEINAKYYTQQLQIDEMAKKQKNDLVKKWNNDPTSINPEIEKRFPIKYVDIK